MSSPEISFCIPCYNERDNIPALIEAIHREAGGLGVPYEIVSPYAGDDDTVVEAALRPKRLDEFVGQERVREQLSLVLQAALARDRLGDLRVARGALLLRHLNTPDQLGPAARPVGALAESRR